MEWLIKLVLDWIKKGASGSAQDEKGRKILRYGKEMKIVGALLSLFWIAMLIAVPVSVHIGFMKGKEDMPWVMALFAGLALMGLGVLIEAYFVKIIYDDTAMVSYSPWRRDIRMIPWGDIQSVRFSQIMQAYICKTRNHGKLILSSYLIGLDEFMRALEEKWK